jgi:adenylate cyclase
MKKITVKGKAQPQQIYAVLGRKDDPSAPPNIDILRKLLGWDSVDLDSVDVDGDEKKFTIVD